MDNLLTEQPKNISDFISLELVKPFVGEVVIES